MESSARRLEPKELKHWHAKFLQFMDPDEMIRIQDILSDIIGEYIFVQAGTQFVREAWVAGRHAKILKAEKVRLLEEDRPDSELIVQGEVLRFEITEADQIGRRRGDEYRAQLEQPGQMRHDPEEDVRARAMSAGEMLSSAIQKKIDKDYLPETGLIIYLNLMEYGWFQSDVERMMDDAVKGLHNRFAVVDVLWDEKLYRYNGQKRTELP